MNVTTRVASCVVVLSLAVTGGAVLAGSGKVALTKADASCGDPTSSDIYFDCGNGTVTDNRTGLIWLKNPGCLTSGPPPGGGEPGPSFLVSSRVKTQFHCFWPVRLTQGLGG